MESTSLLYQTLTPALGCHHNGWDVRHRNPLAWLINGFILSGTLSLNAWAMSGQSRVQYIQSVLRRGLDNERIQVPPLYAPLDCHTPLFLG